MTDTTAAAIDPITLEVTRGRLEAIADEMQHVLLQSSHSIVIKEAGDATSALFTPEGEAIAHAVAIPLHLGVMGPIIRGIADVFPVADWRAGDIYAMNDPFAGGTHLPDITVVAPVVVDGRVVALSAALSHHQDVGGMAPSSMPAEATEVFQEGLRIPPIRLIRDGTWNDDAYRIILANTRISADVAGDLKAQLAAVMTGRTRLLEVIDEFGDVDSFQAYVAELLDRAERMTREEIAAMPSGTFQFCDYLDHDGVELDKRLPVNVTVTIDDSDFTVDFTGTAAQALGPVNGPPSTAFSAVAYVLRAVTDPAIPINGGSERPVRLILPERTLVNPAFPAAVCLRAHLARRIVDAVLGALAEPLGERVPACSASINGLHSVAGVDPLTGQSYSVTDTTIASGMGALAGQDGTDVIEMHTTNVLSVPTEALEMSAPLLVESTQLRQDSGGPGEHRGGVGMVRRIRLRRGSAVSCFRHERHELPPWGLEGGLPGARWSAHIERAAGGVERIPGKAIIQFHEGDVLVIESGGGGGYGDPMRRDPDAVLEDWKDGKITAAHARSAYGVVIDVETLEIDRVQTDRLRGEGRTSA
jgi:N-methylhydantoinase B